MFLTVVNALPRVLICKRERLPSTARLTGKSPTICLPLLILGAVSQVMELPALADAGCWRNSKK
jgi:hypothetical protein